MKLRKAIKRIMALGTGATMVGATIMGAMGAADLAKFPDPFVQDGKFNAYLVLGESGQTPDVIGAVEVATSLQVASRNEVIVNTKGGNNVAVSDGVRIESASQPLRLGLNFTGLGRTTVTSSDLDILKETDFQDEEGNALKAQMKIELPSAFVAFGRSVPSSSQDVDEPVLHVNFDSTSTQYTMVVDFPNVIDPTNLTNEVLTLFGKEFTTGTRSEMSATKLVLYSAAVDQTFTAGQEAVVDVNGQKVTVRVIGVNTQSSTPTATISVNGETESMSEGQTKTLGGQRVYVRDIQAYTQPVGGGGARLFIGSEKTVLQHGSLVEKGTSAESVTGANVTISSSSGKISKIAIGVNPSDVDIMYGSLLPGQELVDPVFGTFKWLFADPPMNPVVEGDADSHISLVPSEDRLRLSFMARGGQQYDVDILKGNGSTGGGTQLLMRANGDASRNFVTAASGQVNRNDYFMIGAGNNEFQRILRLTALRNTSTDKEIQVQDVSSGGKSETWSWDGDSASGTMTYDGNTYAFSVVMSSSSDGFFTSASTTNAIHTYNSNLITVPSNDHTHTGDVLNSTSQYSNGFSNTIGNVSAMNITVKERTSFSVGSKADDYGDITMLYYYANGASGRDLALVTTPAYAADPGRPSGARSAGDTGLPVYSAFNFESPGSDSDRQLDMTPWGTLVEYNSDSNSQTIDLWMPGEQAEFNVFIAPTSASVSAGSGGEGSTVVYETNPINVGAAVLPSEIGDIKQVNAIVVGGPCVNSAAASLMGNPANCAAGFEDGKGMLRLFEHPSGKVSLLVAGYSALDTRRAARVLAQYHQTQASGKLQGTNVEVSGVNADFTDTVVSAATVAAMSDGETA